MDIDDIYFCSLVRLWTHSEIAANFSRLNEMYSTNAQTLLQERVNDKISFKRRRMKFRRRHRRPNYLLHTPHSQSNIVFVSVYFVVTIITLNLPQVRSPDAFAVYACWCIYN